MTRTTLGTIFVMASLPLARRRPGYRHRPRRPTSTPTSAVYQSELRVPRLSVSRSSTASVIPVGGLRLRSDQSAVRARHPTKSLRVAIARVRWILLAGTVPKRATGGRVEVTPQLSVEPSISLNWVELPQGSFTTELLRARVNYTLSPLDVRERSRPVQLRLELAEYQHALPLGVRAGQRCVPGVQRRARHPIRWVFLPLESRARCQVYETHAILDQHSAFRRKP